MVVGPAAAIERHYVMPHSRSVEAAALDYASPAPRPVPSRFERWLVWPLPLWSGLIVAAAYVPVRWTTPPDEQFLFAAMVLQIAVGVGCAAKRRWALACYCGAFPIVVLLLVEMIHRLW